MTPQNDDDPSLSSARCGRSFYFPRVSNEDWNSWKWQYKHRIKTIEEIHSLVGIPDQEIELLRLTSEDLHIGIPPYYFSLIDKDAVPYDPVYLQSVPNSIEYGCHNGCSDPLNEDHTMPVEGLVHRYPDRVLFLSTNMCPMYCRHCTRRREWVDGQRPRPIIQIDDMLEYIRQNRGIRDVVLSGGDPLTLPEKYLEYVLSGLRSIGHVEIIRIGTRYPVVLPQRITDRLCHMLSKYAPIWVNTHFNHANEITPYSRAACRKLLKAGLPVNNQSVLLRGVNDTVEDMSNLCKRLLTIGVRPYYLFMNDNTKGTERFTSSLKTGLDIISAMRGFTSGLAIPTFVIDAPGGGGKIPIQPDYIKSISDNEVVLTNYEGKSFIYPFN